MLDRIIDWWNELGQEKRKIVIGATLGVLFVILVGIAIAGIVDKEPNDSEFNSIYQESTGDTDSADSELTEEGESTEVVSTELENDSESQSQVVEKEDPQNSVGGNMTDQEGTKVDISQVVDQTPSNETREIKLGIDVSKYQGTIDWKKVSEAGVDFAVIRVGYRELVTGKIIADSNAKYNMQEASKYGIKVGAYFFSTAISAQEAVEEANWVADYIAKYQITYPVVYNCEGYQDSENRQYSLTKSQRTDYAIAFLDKIAECGYTPMFYASKSEMEGDAKWETSRLQSKYKIWVAQYPGTPYPQTEKSSYSGKHDMWQYTNKGTVPGISKPVDMNVAYFGFKETQGPQDSEAPEDVEADVEAGMNFREVNETMTAKEWTRLRSTPERNIDTNIVYDLKNGEIVTVTGISANDEWARVLFNNQTLYAWYKNLTTDLTVKETESEEMTYEEANGIKTKFTEVYDKVTPVSSVDHVNLRAKPTTQDSVAKKEAEVKHGEVLERIGVSTDAEHTYSKVRYNGQILYCVTKYLEVIDETTEISSEDTQNE